MPYNPVFDVHREFKSAFPDSKFVIAGGCCRDLLWQREPRDVDVFFLDKFQTRDDLRSLIPFVDWVGSGDGCYTLIARGKMFSTPVDVVYSKAKDVGELVDGFDFNISQFWFDGNGIHSPTSKFEIESEGLKVVNWDNIHNPLDSLRRMAVFSDRYDLRFDYEAAKKLAWLALNPNSN